MASKSRKETNVVHPASAPPRVIEMEAEAPLAIHGESDNPLTPITEITKLPTEPEEFLTLITDEDDMYALRMAGYTSKQIAHHFTVLKKKPYSVKQVDSILLKVAKDNVSRTAEQLPYQAQLELDRIEEALKALWGAVQDGNLQATDRFLKLSERKSKMLGLDSPDVAVSLRLGSQDAVDMSALSTEELKTYLELQKKASSAAKQKVVSVKRAID